MPFRIIKKNQLNRLIYSFVIEAPLIAQKAKPGNFIIIRTDNTAERIPLTIHKSNPKNNTIEIIVQALGFSTLKLCEFKAGNYFRDIIGPLGIPSKIKKYGNVLCMGAGVGVAEMFPVAKALKKAGNEVISLIGARDKNLLILVEKIKKISTYLYITTDDGSQGIRGLITGPLKEILQKHKIKYVFAVGPLIMMQAVSKITQGLKIDTTVSLNSIMVDGTGMCGSCRVRIKGKTKFVCVDGPDFDAQSVDFEELLLRQGRFQEQEKSAADIFKKKNKGPGSHKSCY